MAVQTWRRLGRLLAPDPSVGWLTSHAGASFAIENRQDPDLLDVYVTGRDKNNRSMIGRVTLALSPTPRVLDVEPEPVLTPGTLGAFDENGVSYPCLFEDDGALHLLYTGWMPMVLTPFQNQLGLARQSADGRFERVSRAPILPRVDEDYLGTGSSFLWAASGQWRLWYTSFQSWQQSADGGKPEHHYLIKYATSEDRGTHWQRGGRVCVAPAAVGETSICRPSILRPRDDYHMWYCTRGDHYKLGYASSADGVSWTRRDERLRFVGPDEAWDDESRCYPHVFEHQGDTWMLYSGNAYGAGGLGLARLETPVLA